MKRYYLILAGLLVLAANACAPQVDVEVEKNAIRDMDREWENATNANGAEGWVSFVTEDAVLYPPKDPIVRGKEAIGAYMQPQFPPDATVRWEPDQIEVSSAGDMAFMFGTYEIAVIGPEGDPVSSTGKYGNAWTKMPEGTWKTVASVWNSEQPLPGVEDTSEADREAIKIVSEQVQEAYIARDWDRFAAFFTEDAIWMPDEILPLTGKAEWWSFVEQFWTSTKVVKMDLVSDEIIVAGDWAFERHTETTVSAARAAEGESSTNHYKGVWLLRRQADNSWKIARYIWHWYPAPNG